MDPERVEQGDFAGGEGLFEQAEAGVGEKGADVGAKGEKVGFVESRYGLGGEVQQFGGVFAVSDDAEAGLLHGDHTAKGLDVPTTLDS